jgi:hypothetical protein
VVRLARSTAFEALLPVAEDVVLLREIAGDAENHAEQDDDDPDHPNNDVNPVEHYSDR